MAIEINNVPSATSAVTDVGGQHRNSAQPQVDSQANKSTGQSNSADQVSLTPTAQQLRGLEQQIANQPVVNADRVNAVKEALANGSFEIHPEQIAGKMMSLEKALGDLG